MSNDNKKALMGIKKVEEKYGTSDCSKLKRKGVSCLEAIEESYKVLDKKI